jgi:arylsulfatase A-like enzyme
MKMRARLICVGLAIFAANAAGAAGRPNIVFILADDLGWSDLACYGNDYNQTPNLDRLAREGIRFTQAYAAGPLCSPTRASILTGKYPARVGITDWIPGDYRPFMPLECPPTKQYLELSEVTLAEALKEGGYATAYIGKWHLGEEPQYSPLKQGFDAAVGVGHRPEAYFSPYKLDNLEDGPVGEYLTDRLGREAANLIARLAADEAPYFLFLAHYAVHAPIVAKPDKIAAYRAKGRDQRSMEYAAMLESLDDSVGVVLREIENSGEAGNTIVIFTSDNGGYYQATENWPLRGYKSQLYEGGLRVPLIVRWPTVGAAPRGRPSTRSSKDDAGTVRDTLILSTDYYPTLLECAGFPLKPEQHVDAVSFHDALLGIATPPRAPMVWHFPHYQTPARGEPGSALRDANYKLLHFYDGDRSELYDLAADPGEQHNLARTMPEKTSELRKLLDEKLTEMGAVIPTPNPKP